MKFIGAKDTRQLNSRPKFTSTRLIDSYRVDNADTQLDALSVWADDNKHNIESIQHQADIGRKSMIDGSEIVRGYIAKTGGILYGGTAIDLALRLVGDQIYPDDEAPDLDFYAKNNVEDAYVLADIFYENGHAAARAINARHVKTMKVDVSNGVFVADISFCPAQVFDEIPYLMSATSPSTKIVHPIFQRVDMHSALAIPYDNTPLEVIFHRWHKDLCRFNKLANAYPVATIREKWFTFENTANLTTISAEIKHDWPICGWTALACITANWLNTGGKLIQLRVAKPAIIDASSISFPTTRAYIEYLTDEPVANTTRYESYFTCVHGRFEGDAIWWYPEGRMITITDVIVDDTRIMCASTQFVLYYFLGLFFQYRVSNPAIAAVHLAAYEDLLFMTNSSNELPECLQLSARVYGRHNETLGTAVSVNRMMHDIIGTPLFMTPVNYYPMRSKEKGHPKFDPESSHIFREMGRKMDN